MSLYDVYCNDVLIKSDIKAKEVSELTGIPNNNVMYYAEKGQIKAGKYKVKVSKSTTELLEKLEDVISAAYFIRNCKAEIRNVVINGKECKRTVLF